MCVVFKFDVSINAKTKILMNNTEHCEAQYVYTI